MSLFNKIEGFVSTINVNSISNERKKILQPLIDFIQTKTDKNQEIRLNFICTHNSRRSHFSQVWATEATALFPMVTETLLNSGFHIQKTSEDKNPVYSIKYASNEHPIIGFSKKFDDDFNPISEFAAIMTCSQADEGCPIVSGAEQRFPITFEDPKAFDNSPQQAEKYKERSLQIATDLMHVFTQIKK